MVHMPNNRLKELRLSHNGKKSGTEVAKYLEISPQYYYDVEKGERRLTTEIATKLSKYYDVSVDYIVGVSDIKKAIQSLEDKSGHEESSDTHQESELSEIPIEKLNNYKLTYKGHELSEEEAKDIISLLETALKRWK